MQHRNYKDFELARLDFLIGQLPMPELYLVTSDMHGEKEYMRNVADGACLRCGGFQIDYEVGTDIDGRGGMMEVECERCEGMGFERTPIRKWEAKN